MKQQLTKRHSGAQHSDTNNVSEVCLRLPIHNWAIRPVSGVPGARKLSGEVPIIALAGLGLEQWLGVNPRRPPRGKNGRLRGPIVKTISVTARRQPAHFILVNRGITFNAASGKVDDGVLSLRLIDPRIHGVLDGATTAMTLIVDVVDPAVNRGLLPSISNAHVPIHVCLDHPPELIPQIAEGLNRSARVDDTSLNTMRGDYEGIKAALSGHAGADQASYKQNSGGVMPVRLVVTLMEMLNVERYDAETHPHQFGSKRKAAEDSYTHDLQRTSSCMHLLLPLLPEVLRLRDLVCARLPRAWESTRPSRSDKTWKPYDKLKERGMKRQLRDGVTWLPFLSKV